MTTETILAAPSNEPSQWHIDKDGKLVYKPIRQVKQASKVKTFLKEFFSLEGFNGYLI